MPGKLVGPTQLVLDHAVFPDDERVLVGGTLAEALAAEVLRLGLEAERARAGNLVAERVRRHVHREVLRARSGVAVVERVRDGETVGGGERDEGHVTARVDEHRPAQLERVPIRVLLDEVGPLQQLEEGPRRPVHSGALGPAQLHLEIVDPQRGAAGEEVLDGMHLRVGVAHERGAAIALGPGSRHEQGCADGSGGPSGRT